MGGEGGEGVVWKSRGKDGGEEGGEGDEEVGEGIHRGGIWAWLWRLVVYRD